MFLLSNYSRFIWPFKTDLWNDKTPRGTQLLWLLHSHPAWPSQPAHSPHRHRPRHCCLTLQMVHSLWLCQEIRRSWRLCQRHNPRQYCHSPSSNRRFSHSRLPCRLHRLRDNEPILSRRVRGFVSHDLPGASRCPYRPSCTEAQVRRDLKDWIQQCRAQNQQRKLLWHQQ